MLVRKHEMVAREMETEQQAMPDLDSAMDDDIGDELLRLIFTACHPLLSREARAALALRNLGSLGYSGISDGRNSVTSATWRVRRRVASDMAIDACHNCGPDSLISRSALKTLP